MSGIRPNTVVKAAISTGRTRLTEASTTGVPGNLARLELDVDLINEDDGILNQHARQYSVRPKEP